MLSDKPSDLDLASRILRLEAELDLKAKALGIKFRRSSIHIGAQLHSLAHGALRRIENSLEHFARALEVCVIENVDPWDDVEFFRLSMRELRFTYPSDFLSRLRRGDVVEAYNMDRMQIFRNMRFMEISTYSLLEVLSYEWTQLFDRSSQITQLIIRETEQDMWSKNKVIESQIPRHYIREKLSGSPQVLDAQFRLFAPLFSGPGKPGGMLSVGIVSTVGADVDDSEEKIRFI